MRAACLIALLLATATAQARTLGGDLLFSTDTDDNDIRRTTVNGWEAVSEQLDLGASLNRTEFAALGRHARRVGVQYDFHAGALLSRGDLEHWPLLGLAAQKAQTIFVDRDSPKSGLQAIRAIRENLQRGRTFLARLGLGVLRARTDGCGGGSGA